MKLLLLSFLVIGMGNWVGGAGGAGDGDGDDDGCGSRLLLP